MVQVVYDKILDFCGLTDIPCVIVGTKSDLRRSVSIPDVVVYI
jgi:Ras family protein